MKDALKRWGRQILRNIDYTKAAFRKIPIIGTKWLHGTGIEIGAQDTPIKNILPIYVDRFTEFAGTKCLVDVVADGMALPFQAGSLDYIASSHLFEHLPNPILTLCNWYQLLKPGGIIYLVVPDRRFTFDRFRARTPLSHLLEDFAAFRQVAREGRLVRTAPRRP